MNDDIETLQRQLEEERRTLAAIQKDYAKIQRSKLYALRSLWLWLKRLFTSRRASKAVKMPPRMKPPDIAAVRKALAELTFQEPTAVTVVIPVFNHIDVTLQCLQALAATWPRRLHGQFIVVDDGSEDDTKNVLPDLPNVEYVRSERNQGFVHACNLGAEHARGEYLCFLNNDTIVQDGWIEALLHAIEGDPRVGAVGAKLIYPDGTLQEAGCIIWSDASGWNFGRGQDAASAQFNFLRDVDYCSGAALLTRRKLFADVGAFSHEFAPGYYEDVDLCFKLRARGYRTVYQPKAVVVHLEGYTSGTDIASGAKRYQETNRARFASKWAAELSSHFSPSETFVPAAARRISFGPTVLIIDSYVPMYDREAGSARLMEVIRILRSADMRVIFVGDNYAALQPYTSELQQMGVEVLHRSSAGLSLRAALETVLPLVNVAWICRPEIFEKYGPIVRRHKHVRLLYDTVDLHFVRLRREYELSGGNPDIWQASQRAELAAAREADDTIVVTNAEKQVLQEGGIERVHVIPTIHERSESLVRAYEETAGVLFIGGYGHPPNVAAVKWLVAEIMPLVWSKRPDVRVTLLGNEPTEEVRALASARVLVPGFQRDVRPYFLASRLFVAPLRFGAGMSGKVGQALSYGLPAVLTTLAAEGFDLEHGTSCLLADDATSFADAILRVCEDRELWKKLSTGGLNAIASCSHAAVGPRLVNLISI